MRDAGVNVMLVDKRGVSRAEGTRVAQLSTRFGFREVTLPRKLTRSRRAGRAFCARAKRRHAGNTCTLRAASLRTAGQLASSGNVDLVVVRLKGLPALRSLRIHGKHARIMVLVEIGRHRSMNTGAWTAAIQQAAAEEKVDLGVAPRGSQGATALASYATVLSSNATTTLSAPASLSVQSTTTSSLKVRWQRPNGPKVSAYEAYVNGVRMATVKTTSATLGGLSCGTTFNVAVDALYGSTRSPATTLTTSTSACSDSSPPTSPAGVTVAGITSSSVTLLWTPSSDDVGVVGYGISQGVLPIGSTATTSYVVVGLSCGLTYTLGVDAYDAVGHHSPISFVTATTGACVDASPPTMPTNLVASGVTQSTVTLSWTPLVG